jgi:hypothetical protein
VSENYRFDESINLNLKRDESIVLAWYLTRELWNEEERICAQASFTCGSP